MLSTNDNARDDDRDATSRPALESGVKPRLRFEEWDDEAFEAWECSFDRAYRPARPEPSPLWTDGDTERTARPPVVEEIEEPSPSPLDPRSPAPTAPCIPPPPSTLRGLAPSEPPFVPSVARLPSIVSTDRWPALSPASAEEIASSSQAPSTSLAPVVLAAEPDVDSQPEMPSTCERPAPDVRTARARRLRAWMLAAAAVLVAPGLAGLFVAATGTPHAGATRAHMARAAEETLSPLEPEARELAPRPAPPAKAKPRRRWSKQRRR